MTTMDEQIGRNLVKFRGAMTQRELADAMKQRGIKWSHVTVGAVERGERPLRLAEAEALAQILGMTSASSFTASTPGAIVERAVEDQKRLARTLEQAVHEFLAGQRQLAAYASLVSVDHDINPYFEGEIEWELSRAPEDVAREERIKIRQRVAGEEALELALLTSEEDRELFQAHLEDGHEFDRTMKYNQLLDEKWDEKLGDS